MRYVFRPPADVAAGLLTLPWQLPLEEWQDERLVEIRHRGTSRHVVRFVSELGRLYALKEMNEPLARREYRLLRRLSELGIPAVEPLGIVVDRDTYDGLPLDAVLCTCFLEYSTTYRTLVLRPPPAPPHRPVAGRPGRAARPAPPGRVLLGRLLPVEHPVPPGRRRLAGHIPGRRNQRAAPLAHGWPAGLRRRAGQRAGRRRAAGPGRRRAVAPRRRTGRAGRGDPPAVQAALGHAHSRRDHPARGAAVPHNRAAETAQRPRFRRRRG